MSRPLVMGVVNVTPDSFSDGGDFFDAPRALAQARRLIAEGADILDFGGESTRPGAAPVPAKVEIGRIRPLIETIRDESEVQISVDTMKPEVAAAAVAAGAGIWNDITALGWSEASLSVAAALKVRVVLMHMQGEPRTMQVEPRYDDVVEEVRTFLADRAAAAMAAGVAHQDIWLDPGIGFGKTPAHNLALLHQLPQLADLGFSLVVGVSRKRLIRAIDASAVQTGDRLGGSLAAALWAVSQGVQVVRVHDVRETVQALSVWNAIAGAEPRP